MQTFWHTHTHTETVARTTRAHRPFNLLGCAHSTAEDSSLIFINICVTAQWAANNANGERERTLFVCIRRDKARARNQNKTIKNLSLVYDKSDFSIVSDEANK